MPLFNAIKCCLKAISPASIGIADIGAMGGVSKRWLSLGSQKKIVAFEPDEREFHKLQNTADVHYLPKAVFSKKEALTLNVARDGGKTSLYAPNNGFLNRFPDPRRYETVKTVSIEGPAVMCLDELPQMGYVPDFVKIDTQGSELDILQGAQIVLSRDICGVELEVEFVPLYIGQPVFRDVDAFLSSRGFELFDLRRTFWKREAFYDFPGKGQVIFGDAVYFRSIASMENIFKNLMDADQQRVKLFKMITMTLLYGFYDYAYELAQWGLDHGQLNGKDQELLALIKKDADQGIKGIFYKYPFFSVWAQRLARLMTPPSYLGFADGDQRIGNTKLY